MPELVAGAGMQGIDIPVIRSDKDDSIGHSWGGVSHCIARQMAPAHSKVTRVGEAQNIFEPVKPAAAGGVVELRPVRSHHKSSLSCLATQDRHGLHLVSPGRGRGWHL